MSSVITVPHAEVPWAPVKPGDVLEGKYHVERVLGQGGVGIVVAAWHDVLEQRVAVKLLLPDALRRQHTIERFLREARTAATLRNAHVVRVFDVGTLDDGVPFIVMEYLEGADLAAVLQARGRLDVHEAVDSILQACEGLAEAHAAGIVHRDLKPANLFVTRAADETPFVKVLDFGLAKPPRSIVGASGELTRSDAMMGTPVYMAPEQLLCSRDVDARADVWSLGSILYKCLTGALPFQGETLAAFALSVARDSPVPVRDHRAEVPPALARVIERCLEKDPRHRYQTAAELADALRLPQAALPALRPRWLRSRAMLFAAAAGAVLLAGIGLGAMTFSRFRPRRASAGETAVATPANALPEHDATGDFPVSETPLPAESAASSEPSPNRAAPTVARPGRAAPASVKRRRQPDYGF
jgi:serine/threonine-protein kinase